MVLFQVITLFPERYEVFFNSGLPARAIQKKLIGVRPIQLRDFADPERKGRVDDSPYGGGPGMILQVGPISRALESLPVSLPVLLLTPSGERLTQAMVRGFSDAAVAGNVRSAPEESGVTGGYTLICGFYEGVDQRVAEYLVDREISLGDFILNSGDPAALCLIESISRLIPGFMGRMESADEESFETFGEVGGEVERDGGQLVEYPQYSRPADFNGWRVPEVLLSGNHGAVREWRQQQRVERTRSRGNHGNKEDRSDR